MIAITFKIRSAPRLLQVLRDRKKLELRPRVYLVPSSAVFCILIPERIHHLLVWYGGAIIKVVSFLLKKRKEALLREKRLKKIRPPRAPPAGPSGGRPGSGLRWGLVCFAEVLLVFHDSLGPAPPVCSRAGLTRARSLNTVYSEPNAVKN